MYMTMVPLAEARAQLSRIVDEAVRSHERVEISRNGVRAAVILGADDYDSLMETLDILADADLVKELRAAIGQIEAGEALTTAEVLEDLPAARRGTR